MVERSDKNVLNRVVSVDLNEEQRCAEGAFSGFTWTAAGASQTRLCMREGPVPPD